MSGTELASLLPILILALGATLILMLGAWYPARRPLMIGGIALSFAAALAAALVTPALNEVGGMFGTGPYARFFTVVWSLTAAMTLMLSMRYGEHRGFSSGEYVSLVLFASAGMALLSGATSLVGLFLGLESFTLALYILIAFDKKSPEGTEAGLKYLVLGAVATGFLAFGIALIYVATGTFHLPEAVTGLAAGGELRTFALLGWGMLIVAIGFKVSLVPFHLWTPDVYQGAPAPVTALLSTGSKGAVFAALVGVFAGMDSGQEQLTPLIWALAVGTMLVGTFCALRQENLKRMLAYSSVVHMGYVLVGLLAGGEAGSSAVVFYLVAYTAAGIGSFAVITSFADNNEPQDYTAFRGIGYRHPLRCGVLAAFLISLAGIPPTAGFIGKFGIFHAAIKADYLSLALFGVAASVISLYYYLQVVILMFMSEEEGATLHRGGGSEQSVLAICLGAVLLFGIYPGPLLDLIAGIIP